MKSAFGVEHSDISKAFGAKKSAQVASQLKAVADTKGFTPKFKKIANAKAAAGAKFQNK